jgi:hypothetical protein
MTTTKKLYTPNDDRSQVKDPKQAPYAADRANRIEQGHDGVPPAPTPSTKPAKP